MVVMLVTGQDVADVADAVAERLDVVGDNPRIFLGSAVDQDISRAPHDKDRGNAATADQVGVGVNPDRRGRLIP